MMQALRIAAFFTLALLAAWLVSRDWWDDSSAPAALPASAAATDAAKPEILDWAAPAAEAPPPSSADGLTGDERNNIAIFEQASPSVVFVTNTQLRRRRFSRNVLEIPRGSGTGFVWDAAGLIVTNFHVVYGAGRITITLQSGRSYEGQMVGTAPEKDIALLRIDAPDEALRALPLGDSAALAVGRKVLAIGNPFALDSTLTVGVVSALGREIKSITNRTIRDVIQTDAAINPGNSGGPLLDSQGRLVGVNTAIYSPTGASAGIGFAIPVNTLKSLIPQLERHGRLLRPVLGVDLLDDYWHRRLDVEGVVIRDVREGYPAEQAGMMGFREDRGGNIHFGDVITAINGAPVATPDALLLELEKFNPGDQVTVTTQRDDTEHEYQLILAAPDE